MQVWARPLVGGAVALLLFNNNGTTPMNITWFFTQLSAVKIINPLSLLENNLHLFAVCAVTPRV